MGHVNKYITLALACIAVAAVIAGISMLISHMFWHKLLLTGSGSIDLHGVLYEAYDKALIECGKGYPMVYNSTSTIIYNESKVTVSISELPTIELAEIKYIGLSCFQNNSMTSLSIPIQVVLERKATSYLYIGVAITIVGVAMIIALIVRGVSKR